MMVFNVSVAVYSVQIPSEVCCIFISVLLDSVSKLTKFLLHYNHSNVLRKLLTQLYSIKTVSTVWCVCVFRFTVTACVTTTLKV